MHQTKGKSSTSSILLASLLTVSAFAQTSCTDKSHDCVALATCSPITSKGVGGTESGGASTALVGGAATTSGEAGAPSSASSGAGGSVGGGSVGGGSTVAQGLAGGSPVGGTTTQPCNGPCGADKPICDEQTNTCVECTTAHNEVCTATGKVCGENATCVECEKSEHCQATIGRPICDKSPYSAKRNTCVQCLTAADCKSAETPVCDTSTDPSTNLSRNVCVGCTKSEDCDHNLEGKRVCLTGSGTVGGACVQCTKDNADACVSNGIHTLCNGQTHACSEKTEKSAGLCNRCVADAECQPGQACVQQAFGLNQDLLPEFACLWKKGDTAPGAPANCSDPANQPYVVTRSDVVTIDGATATVCGLAVSTCAAWTEAKSPTIDCAPDGTPNHALCIIESHEAARCILASTGKYQCSPRCGKDSDCLYGISTCVSRLGEQACAQ